MRFIATLLLVLLGPGCDQGDQVTNYYYETSGGEIPDVRIENPPDNDSTTLRTFDLELSYPQQLAVRQFLCRGSALIGGGYRDGGGSYWVKEQDTGHVTFQCSLPVSDYVYSMDYYVVAILKNNDSIFSLTRTIVRVPL